jgi:hypothetical protein
LHRFRKVSVEELPRFQRGERAYQRVRIFLEETSVLDDFRRAKERPSSLGIEVRKDLLCTFDPASGRPSPPTREQQDKATLIGNVVASAIRTYFDTDRQFL